MVLTFAGFATLWGAIAADVGASVLVVLNALRLLHGDASAEEADAVPGPDTMVATAESR